MAKKKQDTFKIGQNSNDELSIGVLLDMSGSMITVKSATISGFNEYLVTMKNKSPESLFTLVTFNSIERKEVVVDTPIKNVVDLTDKTYLPDGGTPLYDSCAYIIKLMSERIANKKNKKALLMIMTDGQENESKEYSREAVKKLIEEKEAEGWTIGYMGANQDAWAVAHSIGVAQGNSLNYDVHHMAKTFSRMADASVMYTASAGVVKKGLFADMQEDDKESE